MKDLSPERERILMALLADAIAKGAPAPSNPVIAEKLGYRSIASACEAVSFLERKGLIEVERGLSSRVIRMRDQSTAPSVQAAFTRTSAHIETLTRVHRKPCFFCGTRSDVGCKHGVAA